MTTKTSRARLFQASALTSVMLAALSASAAQAQEIPPASTGIRNSDDIVVTGTKVNAETPITASIHTTEPQAIVSRSIIENSVPPTADISDVILLTPGASGTSNGNGPGLSESKTVLRGFQDGFFNVTYDGIPFGDTNNPTHHSTAYFPTGTYERIIVDRGPGGATDLGQASFGGNVHIVSRELSDKAGIDAQAVYGSYSTYLGRLTLQSGSIDKLGGHKVIAIGEYKDTKGALTASPAWFANGFIKIEKPLGDTAKLSFLSSYNQDFYDQSDNNGVTCTGALVAAGVPTGVPSDGSACLATSQVGMYGKQFGLVDVNEPRFAGTPWPNARHDFNWTNKTTDFEIARLQIQLNDWISFDDKAYTYFYKNFTVSTQSSTVACLTSPTDKSCRSTLNVGGVLTLKNGDIPGYTKVNQYRNYGDIAQLDFKTPIGIGKIGIWYESSSSHRYRYSYDLSAASAAGVFKYRNFDFAGMTAYYDYNRNSSTAGLNVQLDGTLVPTYVAYDEYTGWQQIQGFGEFNFKLFDNRLTLTPGVKVQNFTRDINTPIASQSARVGIQAQDSYKPTLPYFTANFLAQPNWSFYAQFAKGFLVPQLADSLEAVIPDGAGGVKCSTGALSGGNCNLQPTKTTNYQFGTVYAGDRLNIDADIYYIKASNSTSVDPSTGNTTTSGTPAIYKGVEAQVSYQFLPHLTGIVNGSLNSAKNDDSTKLWLTQAPNYTALAGLVYNSKNLKISYLHKFTGRQYADAGNAVRIAPYSGGIASGTYYFGPVGVGVTVYNVFDDQSTTKIGSSTSPTTPLYFFQPGRSYEAQVRFKF